MSKFYLLPGAIFANRNPHIVDTVLGSCVSIVLWDSVLQFGGINHYMLPKLNRDSVPSNKYGDISTQGLIQTMLQLGSEKENLRAKVFGGSVTNHVNGIFQIGRRNVEFAFHVLKLEKIPVISHSVGGMQGRKIVFYSENGDVLMKLMKSAGTIMTTSVKQP
jgi:chemotaxis protein CheD